MRFIKLLGPNASLSVGQSYNDFYTRVKLFLIPGHTKFRSEGENQTQI